MDDSVSIQVVTGQDTKHRLPCTDCDNNTNHLVLAAVEISGSTADGYIHFWEQHELVQCQGCESISYRRDAQNTEDTDWDREGNEYLLHHEELFPPRVTGRKPLQDTYSLPSTVRTVYEETYNALTANLRILAGIGIRSLVESVCKEKVAPGKNLEQKIDGLANLGLLTKAGAEILHGTRLLGNTAAHEQRPLDLDSLNAAMHVAEHLLMTVYILPAVATRLPKRSTNPRPDDGRRGDSV